LVPKVEGAVLKLAETSRKVESSEVKSSQVNVQEEDWETSYTRLCTISKKSPLTYLILQSDGEEPTSPVPAADEVEVSGDAAASSGSMSVLDALKGKHQQYLPTTSIP
jgi:hypothetical protein